MKRSARCGFLLPLVVYALSHAAVAYAQSAPTLIAEARRLIDDLNPDSAGTLLHLALDSRARPSRPDSIRAFVLMGITRLMASRLEDASTAFRTAVVLDPDLRVDSLSYLHSHLLVVFTSVRAVAVGAAERRPAAAPSDSQVPAARVQPPAQPGQPSPDRGVQPEPARTQAAAPPPPRAARPTSRPRREGSAELSIGLAAFALDQQLIGYLDMTNIAEPAPGRLMLGGVARVGYNLTSKLGLSAGAGFGVGNGATLLSPFGAVTYTLDLNKRFSPFVSVGAEVTRFSGNGNSITSVYGAHLGVGIRSKLGENMALRIEGRIAHENFDEFGGMTALNGIATVGLSYFMGGGPPRDTDADGVPDKRDRCASTQRGATVDLRGCPSDTDRDGVLNGLDRCPNTPLNTPVNAVGCSAAAPER